MNGAYIWTQSNTAWICLFTMGRRCADAPLCAVAYNSIKAAGDGMNSAALIALLRTEKNWSKLQWVCPTIRKLTSKQKKLKCDRSGWTHKLTKISRNFRDATRWERKLKRVLFLFSPQLSNCKQSRWGSLCPCAAKIFERSSRACTTTWITVFAPPCTKLSKWYK